MGFGDVRPLRTIRGVDFTGQERAALNKLTMPVRGFRRTEHEAWCFEGDHQLRNSLPLSQGNDNRRLIVVPSPSCLALVLRPRVFLDT